MIEFTFILTVFAGIAISYQYASLLLKDENQLILQKDKKVELLISIIVSTWLMMLASAFLTYLVMTE